jgi:pimeloyl-ACP methyl ester carboxylesterase
MKDIERIRFKTSANKTLSGELRKAPSDQLVVLCHGYKSSSRSPAVSAITSGLHEKGYATFAFDFPEGSDVDVRRQVSDIADVLQHLDHYKRFILVATSYGALSASIAAINIARVSGLVTVNGFFGLGKLGKERRRTFRLFRLGSLVLPRYRKIWKYFKAELRPEALAVPVLVIHSQVDQQVFIEQSRYFFKNIASPKQFITLEHATHGLSGPGDVAVVVAAIDGWLKR